MQQPHNKQAESPLPRPPGSDVESGATPARVELSSMMKGDWMKKWVLIFRACALLLSFLSFILMVFVSNFHLVGGLSFMFAVAIFTMIYTAIQVGINGHELRTSEIVIPPKAAIWIGFCGDQFLAYMLLSSATSGATLSVIERNNIGYTIYDSGSVDLVSASATMSIFAFLFLAPAAIFSASRLFTNI